MRRGDRMERRIGVVVVVEWTKVTHIILRLSRRSKDLLLLRMVTS
jgi:hypothetical protein